MKCKIRRITKSMIYSPLCTSIFEKVMLKLNYKIPISLRIQPNFFDTLSYANTSSDLFSEVRKKHDS